MFRAFAVLLVSVGGCGDPGDGGGADLSVSMDGGADLSPRGDRGVDDLAGFDSATPDLATVDGGAGACGNFGVPDVPTGQEPNDVVIADLDGDGKPDLAVASSIDFTITTYFNRGDGTFSAGATYPVGMATARIVAGDVNGDGKPDLLVADGDNKIGVLLNQGAGLFAAEVTYPTGNTSVALALGDVDSDGKVDVWLAIRAATPTRRWPSCAETAKARSGRP